MTAIAPAPALVVDGPWEVRLLVLSEQKIVELWEATRKIKSLFSDVTKDDFGNFVAALTDRQTIWFEIALGEETVGIIWVTDLAQMVDANVHMAFLDRQPAEKKNLCRKMMKWTFANYPMHRVSVQVPAFYHATDRLVRAIGFSHEGTKREAVLIGGRWSDVNLYGITRKEVEAMP